MAFNQIAVVGAGAWGMALANVIARAGRSVTLGTRDPLSAAAIMQRAAIPAEGRVGGLGARQRDHLLAEFPGESPSTVADAACAGYGQRRVPAGTSPATSASAAARR